VELSCKFGNFFLPFFKQALNFYYLDLEVVEQEIDLASMEMVVNVVGLDFVVERVEEVEENIVVKNMVRLRILRVFSISIFPSLCPRLRPRFPRHGCSLILGA